MSKLLVGKKGICDYLDITDYLFMKFIKIGMPAKYESGRYYAHKENLNEFFRQNTAKRVPEYREETEHD